MMRNILIATGNLGKLKEFQALLTHLDIEFVTPAMLGLSLNIKEEGLTYAENAASKARAYAETSGLISLADDSGLEVDALGGAPGLYSARFSPLPDATDADRRARLLTILQTFPRPWTARFRCTLAIAPPGQEIRFTEGACAGEIIPEERGSDGFGYDPVFYIPSLGRTMAELPMEEKNQISHRGRAIQAARPVLREILGLPPTIE